MEFKGYGFRKTHVAFFITIPLLMATAMAGVDCPVCNGDGSVSNNVAMEQVQITGTEAVELGVKRNTCGMFLMYNYSVKLSIENNGPETATGWVMLYLIDYTEGKRLDTQYTVVEIPGNKSWEISYIVWFVSGHDEPVRTEVLADIFTGQVPCATCDGSGEISLNAWPIASSLKEKFIQLEQIEKPWSVPPWPVNLE